MGIILKVGDPMGFRSLYNQGQAFVVFARESSSTQGKGSAYVHMADRFASYYFPRPGAHSTLPLHRTTVGPLPTSGSPPLLPEPHDANLGERSYDKKWSGLVLWRKAFA